MTGCHHVLNFSLQAGGNLGEEPFGHELEVLAEGHVDEEVDAAVDYVEEVVEAEENAHPGGEVGADIQGVL